MKNSFVLSIFVSLALTWFNYAAAEFEFTNIDEGELETIVEEFGANFMHTSVSGANTLGSIFGFEVGLVAGISNVDGIEKIVQESDPNADAGTIPHAALLGVLTIPAGLTFEINFIPTIDSSDVELSNFGGAIKWTATETILSALPLSLALKLYHTQSKLEFKQTVSSVTSTISFESSATGLMLLASKDLLVIEPYVGVGTVSVDGEVTATGSTIFDFTASQSASKKSTGTQYLLGAEIKLLIFKIGLEYSNHLSVDRYTGKLSFYF